MPKLETSVLKLKGPIVVFGAGGFIGVNLLKTLLSYRDDVFGISSNPKNNWRFLANHIKFKKLLQCDITDPLQVKDIVAREKPQTVINMAAYGAYSKQREYKKIYETNFNALVNLIESLKEIGFSSFVQAGSSSEYGLNSDGPNEEDELMPNSHYAVSKVAAYNSIKYYGKIEGLPVISLRIYSAFGPWEEPDRLIPMLISKARHGDLPELVEPKVSRDFIFVDDVVSSFITCAADIDKKKFGEVYNAGTGLQTTIEDLVSLVRRILNVNKKPKFGSMKNRNWDMKNWYGDISKIKKDYHWQPKVSLEEGIKRSIEWQIEINYDNADWNWTKLK